MPQGLSRDLIAGRCLGHPLCPQCPWVLLGLFSLFWLAVGPHPCRFHWGFIGVLWGSVGILWGFCCHSSHIATPHFSVKEVRAPASLQLFLGILVGLWEIGQGWGMEGTGTCSGGGYVRSHPGMSCLPGRLEVGGQPVSLSGGRIILLMPEAPCPWQALRQVGEVPFGASPKGEPGYLII